MSYDLMVFEKSKVPGTYDDFLKWTTGQTEWAEERDYNSTEGTADKLRDWFMAIKEMFPPLNGEYSLPDDVAFANVEIENHLTDYSIGSEIIYASFGWSVAEEAKETVRQLAEKYDVGVFDFQSGEVYFSEIAICRIRTEKWEDRIATWELVENELLSLGDPERPDGFLTIWFEGSGMNEEFMQCVPIYTKPQGILKKIFSASESRNRTVEYYQVEAGTGDKIYIKSVNSKEAVWEIIKCYYSEHKLPDLRDWEDSGLI